MTQLNEFRYDEDISKNKFFIKLQKDNKIMLETAAMEKWIICLPRNESLESVDFCATDFILSHILVPSEELPSFFFTTLIGENFELNNGNLTSRSNKEKRQVLFEEIFYTEEYYKIRIWCVSYPLLSSCKDIFQVQSIVTADEASQFLVHETGSTAILKVINNICTEHTKENSRWQVDIDVKAIKTNVQELIEKCIKLVLSRKCLREKFNSDCSKMQNLRIALALRVLTTIHEIVFEAFSSMYSDKSEKFNRSLRRMHTSSAEQLKIPPKYHPLLATVKQQFTTVGLHMNPLGKLLCMKKAVEKLRAEDCSPLVDDLIPIFVYAIIKSGYPHWIATSVYVRELLHFFEGNYNNTYENFLLTTLDAALYFIMTETWYLKEPTDIKHEGNCKSKKEFLEVLFKLIEANDEIGVLKLFNVKASSDKEIFNIILDKRSLFLNAPVDGCDTLCHPLCDCDECQVKIAENYPDVNSSNDHGLTALHVAASSGFARMVSILISLGCNVNACDHNNYTPLHYAASKGHQSVLLLLLNSNANINSVTVDGATPLHLATINGHSSCVKGLLFFSDHIKVIHDIDRKDGLGHTALCIASKWGYSEIVEILLEYGATTDNNSAEALAHNSRIKSLIKNYNNKRLQACETSNTICHNTQNSRKEKIFSAIKNNDIKLFSFYLELNEGTTNDLRQRINNLRNEDDDSLLHFAARNNRAEIIETLLQNGAQPDILNKYGQTAMHIACRNNVLPAAIALLRFSNVNFVDVQDQSGNTPMHDAVMVGAFEIAQVILQHYPDLELRNKKNLRALDLCREHTSFNLLERATCV